MLNGRSLLEFDRKGKVVIQDSWNPSQYERFRNERSQPFFDLMGMVQPEPGTRVIDLGCGTGELTQILHRHLKASETIGLDSSDAMLAKCAIYSGEGLHFVKGDIGDFAPEQPYDLIFSNAALQWAPGHETLLRRLTAGLAKGGQLAVQVPANHDHPAHAIAGEVAQESPFRVALGGYFRQKPILDPEEYATLLDRLGYREQQVRLQVYGHHLSAREDVVEWVKGTLLTDYQRRMPAELFAQYLDRYRERLMSCLEDKHPYFYPFKRILFWARL